MRDGEMRWLICTHHHGEAASVETVVVDGRLQEMLVLCDPFADVDWLWKHCCLCCGVVTLLEDFSVRTIDESSDERRRRLLNSGKKKRKKDDYRKVPNHQFKIVVRETNCTMENEKGHQVLQQIPLAKAPLSQAPRPVELPAEYKQLPPSVPETRVTKEDLELWVRECNAILQDIKNYGKEDMENYSKWHDRMLHKLAPGYIGGSETLLMPKRKVAREGSPTVEESLSSLEIKQ